jgi:hypothetical protein
MADNKVQPPQINIELGDDVAEGVYSNMAMITHSNAEFVMDFIRLMPGIPKARVKSRIVMTPLHAKRLLRALNENIGKFEATHGPIHDNESGKIPMGFGGPTAQA